MNAVLMVAYHFPPLVGSSGIQRTLRFAQQLPQRGWQPIVLTVHPRAYERIAACTAAPESFPVIRAQAWDAARHLSVAGRYPRVLAQPDRWSSWRWDATLRGLAAIRRHRPTAIWSTFPIATAHVIAHALARRSALPWIADFRDPMAQDDYPSDPRQRAAYQALERQVVAHATASVFVSPSALSQARQRHPDHAERMLMIENGYDDAMVAATHGHCKPTNRTGHLTVLHSGIVYPSERDPSALIEALARLKASAPEIFGRIRLRFRGAIHEDHLAQLVDRHAVNEAVEILPICSHDEAVQEMACADGLLVLQATNCNAQIPAKYYEYLACRRPLLLLTDPQGDTACAARAAGIEAIAPLSDAQAIASLLTRFVASPEDGTRAREEAVLQAARSRRSDALADLLDRVAGTADRRANT